MLLKEDRPLIRGIQLFHKSFPFLCEYLIWLTEQSCATSSEETLILLINPILNKDNIILELGWPNLLCHSFNYFEIENKIMQTPVQSDNVMTTKAENDVHTQAPLCSPCPTLDPTQCSQSGKNRCYNHYQQEALQIEGLQIKQEQKNIFQR